MSEIQVEVGGVDPALAELPAPDTAQAAVCARAELASSVVRGAPGSGRTTCALMVLDGCRARGESAVLWVPDRSRVDVVEARVQALLPEAVRPVRTPAAYAYQVVSTWRIGRGDPLGTLELVTGAQEDQLIQALLARGGIAWPDSMPEAMRAMPAFRMEVRNLFARAGEAGIDGAALGELGSRFGHPEWVSAGSLLAMYEGDPGFAVTTRGAMSVDTSRIQRIASDLVARWEADAPGEGVTAVVPLPDVVVVDDLQDCTASTVELLASMARRGVRVVAFADPDVAVASYRGGEPHLDQRLAERLDVPVLELGEVHRGTAALRDLARDVTGRISTSGPVRRRTVGVAGEVSGGAPADGGSGAEAGPGGVGSPRSEVSAPRASDVLVHLAASEAQMGAITAHHLSAHHLHDGVAWEDQVVIVRSSGDVAEVRRQLRRGGVPVAGRRRAIAFSAEPVTRTLLELVAGQVGLAQQGRATTAGGGVHPPAPQSRDSAPRRSPDPTAAEDADRVGELELARRLLESPFVRADALDVHRLLRALNSRVVAAGDEAGDDEDATDVVEAHYDVLSLLEDAESLAGCEDEDLHDALVRAGRMWAVGRGPGTARPRAALWALWDASGLAEQWRDGALAPDRDAEWYDDQLDALLALFRVADVWEQRNPAGSAREFCLQLLADDVPTDTITRMGIRPPGVDVLTPAQAMGREWEVVAVLGLQDGRWPNLRLRDRVLRADLLADLAAGRTGTDAQGHDVLLDDPRSARRGVLDDETRLLAASVTRSRRVLHVAAVRTEQQAPSQFLDVVARHAPVDLVEGEVPLERVPPSLDLPGQVGRLRHLAAQPEDTPQREVATTLLAVLAGEGVRSADPAAWTGAGGLSTEEPVLGQGPVFVSPSKVQSARECALKWFLASAGGSPSSGGAQQLGTLVHAIAQRHPHGPLDVMLEELDVAWEEIGHDLSTWVGQREHAHAESVVRALASYMEGVPGEVGVEVPVRVPVGDLVITGSIDRLEVVDEGVRIVDLKTGKPSVTKDGAEEHPQLATYQVALLAQGRAVSGARLVFLGNGKVEERLQGALEGEHLEQWRTDLEDLADTMRAGTFRATPSEQACRYCPFRRSCPAMDQGRRTLA
ncbi:PD-(D/E)XK nuclease family protein [Actinomyces sp.]|uniref:PD-(D/E)XK nuclease family protein n=1 Tax=Actinomyces sp. TaxID=29317 RepID=UPI0028A18E74|nr:PD-(D/E)XK nuclease family protein [Actinomyces sp.]